MSVAPKILVATVHPGIVSYGYHDSILRLLASNKYDVGFQHYQSGVLISKARNELWRSFLESPAFTHILWVDSDIQFSPEAINALLEYPRPIASGLYLARDVDGEVWPVALRYDKDEGTYVRVREELSGSKPVQVGAVGLGFCLVERQVAEKLGTGVLWPFAEILYNGQGVGEDVTFCIRAREEAFRSFVVPAARVGHSKTVIL